MIERPLLPLLTCPTCTTALRRSPHEPIVQSCPHCRRPILILRSLVGRTAKVHGRNLLDLGLSLYGMATVALLALYIGTDLPNRLFARLFAVLLFAFSSLCCVDGWLSVSTAIDRTLSRISFGRAARWLGALKLVTGVAALGLCVVGLSL